MSDLRRLEANADYSQYDALDDSSSSMHNEIYGFSNASSIASFFNPKEAGISESLPGLSLTSEPASTVDTPPERGQNVESDPSSVNSEQFLTSFFPDDRVKGGEGRLQRSAEYFQCALS